MIQRRRDSRQCRSRSQQCGAGERSRFPTLARLVAFTKATFIKLLIVMMARPDDDPMKIQTVALITDQ
jgi:hypothetical protein